MILWIKFTSFGYLIKMKKILNILILVSVFILEFLNPSINNSNVNYKEQYKQIVKEEKNITTKDIVILIITLLILITLITLIIKDLF